MLQLLQTGTPPSNLSFLIAAFVVTGLVFLGYAYFIFRRKQETKTEINRLLLSYDDTESIRQQRQ